MLQCLMLSRKFHVLESGSIVRTSVTIWKNKLAWSGDYPRELAVKHWKTQTSKAPRKWNKRMILQSILRPLGEWTQDSERLYFILEKDRNCLAVRVLLRTFPVLLLLKMWFQTSFSSWAISASLQWQICCAKRFSLGEVICSLGAIN